MKKESRGFTRKQLELMNACDEIVNYCRILDTDGVKEENKVLYYNMVKDFVLLQKMAFDSDNRFVRSRAMEAKKAMRSCNYIANNNSKNEEIER